MSSTLSYRRDIDGLRALAILPVVLYHTHTPGFGGGYIGVDVFFVISGYLITAILAREIDSDTYSLVRFYERRARRILPALLLMMMVVLAVAAWLYLPGDFEGVPRSALMTLAFLSNVWFFMKAGYFAGPAETMPLLHCWSLAVEEQFYIAFPWLLLICARRAPPWRIPLVLLLTALSLGWAWWKQADTDAFAFYLLPPRAWELLAGALLALGAVPVVRQRLWRELWSWSGLALIAFAVLTYDRHTVFPGIMAIPPVLGTALLLHCAPGTLAGRLLVLPPLVGIGLISYSLYLWHWPLIVFTEYAIDSNVTGATRIAVLLASLALAWVSWRFVERPFRNARAFSRQRIFIMSGTGMAMAAMVAGLMLPLGGWSGRFSPQVNHFIAGHDDISPKRAACLSKAIDGERPECTFGARAAPSVLVWGDSHGVELSWVLGQTLGRHGQAVMERTRGSCPPMIGYSVANDPGCALFNQGVLAQISQTPSIRRVYLVAYWAGGAYRQPRSPAMIDTTIAQLQAAGKQVTLIGPIPTQPFDVPRHLAHAAAMGTVGNRGSTTLADHRKAVSWLTDNYPRWRAKGVTIVDPLAVLADGDRTRLMMDGKPLYFDYHHLSLTGAKAVLTAN